MAASELPLRELHARLRAAGLPLGPGEYLALLRALSLGYGLPDRAALLRLCWMLWARSPDEAQLVSEHLAQVLAELEEAPQAEIPSSAVAVGEDARGKEAAPAHAAPAQPAPAQPATAAAEEAAAFSRASRWAGDLPPLPPERAGEYDPVTRRQMKQGWRYLRRVVRRGPPEELDVAGTVEQIGRQGMLLQPVLVPRRRNQAELVLLLDRGGSMVPFHGLEEQLVETAARGGRLGRFTVCYFHNAPIEYLYRDAGLCEGDEVEAVLGQVRDERASVLIFSDGGAARGRYRPERVAETREFLLQCRRRVRRVAWLNPMPRERWRGTSARVIAGLVPMFAMDRRGLDQAIAALRGRHLAGHRP